MRFTRFSAADASEQLRQELALLKSGARHVYADTKNKPVHDITPEHITLLEDAIAKYGRKTLT
jgi:hypothetical protein